MSEYASPIRIRDIVQSVIDELESARTHGNLVDASRFDKDKAKFSVLRTGIMRDVSRRYFNALRDLTKKQRIEACHELLNYRTPEACTVAFDWGRRMRKDYSRSDFDIFARWLKDHVSGWGPCDDLCTGPLGLIIHDYPKLAPRVLPWTRSRNQWLRRGAAVSLIPSVRKQLAFDMALKVAKTLLTDKEDYVQKGYGWLLKEASNHYRDEVHRFVMDRRATMPRTALRYAIEKMPPDLKAAAMKKPL